MRLTAAALGLVLMTSAAWAQTPAPAVDPGPAVEGNSDPAMPMKPKMHMKKHMKHMHKKKMM